MEIALDVIIEAVEIIRANRGDKDVLREQLGLIDKYAREARQNIMESAPRRTTNKGCYAYKVE